MKAPMFQLASDPAGRSEAVVIQSNGDYVLQLVAGTALNEANAQGVVELLNRAAMGMPVGQVQGLLKAADTGAEQQEAK